MKKKILDACCGSRMFWFDKKNPDVVFMDRRAESCELCDGRRLEVSPDVVGDFRQMPFNDGEFDMVVFDPPHLHKLGENSWMAKKYGVLGENWREDLRKGFDECMRVLRPGGALVFKWNETQIKVIEILSLIPYRPLFGHPTGRSGKTIWMCFMKSSL